MSRILFAPALLLVSACGGGESSNFPQLATPKSPTSPSGYAQAGNTISSGDIFSVSNGYFYLRDASNTEGTLTTRDFTQEILAGGASVIVTIGGQPVTLTSPGNGVYTGTLNGQTYLLQRYSDLVLSGNNSVVEGVYLAVYDADQFLGGYQVIGFNTDPGDVPASGTATYNGNAAVTVRSGTDDGFANGPITLDADFGTGSISGSFVLSDSGDSNAEITLPDITVQFDPVGISGNAFGANPTITFGTLSAGSTLTLNDDALVQGQFYGNTAQAVGGSLTTTGELNGTALIVEGVFVAGQ